MRIREGDEPVRFHGNGSFDCLGKAFFRLEGQAVEKIHIDTYVERTQDLHDVFHRDSGRLTVYASQDLLVEILCTDTQSVETGFDQLNPALFHYPARMAFDCYLRIGDRWELV